VIAMHGEHELSQGGCTLRAAGRLANDLHASRQKAMNAAMTAMIARGSMITKARRSSTGPFDTLESGDSTGPVEE
jgi:hypothetical protein